MPATQSVEFGASAGQTVTAKLFAAGSDTVVQTASAVTAATNRTGVYTATFTDAAAGTYRLIATNAAGTLLAQWWVDLTLTTATFQAYEMPVAVVQTTTTNNDKTGYSLSSSQTFSTTGSVGSVTGSVGSVTGAVGSVTGAVGSVTARVTANTDQWNGVTVTGMPMPTYAQPTGFLAATFPATVSSLTATGVRTELSTELGRIDATVSSRSSHTAADVWSVTTRTLTAFGFSVTVGTNNDKTGYSLTAGSGLGNQTANITGNLSGSVGSVSGSVGSISGVTFPTNFDKTEIANNGHVSVVVQSIANNSITASSIQGGAITAAKFATDAITAAALAADAVTEIQSGLATLSNQTSIKTTTDRLATMLVADGAVYQYTANALELAPGGGGGSGDASQTTLLEVQGTVEAIAASLSGTSVTVTSQISQGGEITLYCGDDYRVRSSTQLDVTITDVGGAIYSRLTDIGIGNLSFGACRPTQSAGAISGTVASLSQAGSGSSQTITITVEIEDGGAALRPADDYVWQIVSSEQHGSEYDTQTEIEGTLVLRRRVAVPVYA